MCGICVCVGSVNAVKKVFDGLKILEYRGYDSSGIAFIENDKIKCVKTVGDISNLEEKISSLQSNIAIGHTRWATHGGVTIENAHPHLSASKNLAIVHNGIVENYKELKKEFNISTTSQTDSEVFCDLIEKENGSLLEKTISASKLVKGGFAIALLSNLGEVVLAKRENPLYVAQTSFGVMATSDIYVFCDITQKYYTLSDDEFAKIENGKIFFFDKNGKKIKKKCEKIKKNLKKVEIFEKTHMRSEILETKNSLFMTYKNYQNGKLFEKIFLPKKLESICLIACGTAYHSALQGAMYFKKIKIPSQAYIASEFRYGDEILNKNTLYILISQSGETLDTIACAKMLKEKGMALLALTNTKNCYLNQICQNILPTFAGKEIAVASTKAYSCQVFVLYLFSLFLSGKFSDKKKDIEDFLKELSLTDIDDEVVDYVASFEKIFFVGRGFDYVTALESSLKLKEITYINSFAICAGELKHGTLALVDDKTIVISFCTFKKTKEKLFSNLEEIIARGGKVLVVSDEIVPFKSVRLPTFLEEFMPIVSVIPMQFLALKICEKLGYNPDKPKNLAKSVTVE